LGPLEGNLVIAGEGFHPGLVVGGALAKDFLAQQGNTEDLAEKNEPLAPVETIRSSSR
jgi:hypothetical protein